MNATELVTAPTTSYWEGRARRWAGEGEGLRAVCSYGMPGFYNRAIHLGQRRALAPWLEVAPGTRVLDVGCGVGRWSRQLAARGAEVTGVDLSATMVEEASRRAAAAGLADRCRFRVADLSRLELGERYPLIVGVTVLQHILEPDLLAAAVERLAAHLAPGGRMVLLEAAPSRPTTRCDSPVFRARTTPWYLRHFAAVGLELETLRGVDPAPWRPLFLPFYGRLPAAVGVPALAIVTTLSLPVDTLLGPFWVRPSWHKVFVLRGAREAGRE